MYTKYGPELLTLDLTDAEHTVFLAEDAKVDVEEKARKEGRICMICSKVCPEVQCCAKCGKGPYCSRYCKVKDATLGGHKKRCAHYKQCANILEERALSDRGQILRFTEIDRFFELAESEIRAALSSATRALSSSSPRIEGYILVLHVRRKPAESDPSLAFELCDAELCTDAEVCLMLGLILAQMLQVFPKTGFLPSKDSLGRKTEKIGDARIVFTDVTATPRDPNSRDSTAVDFVPLVYPLSMVLERKLKERTSPSDWRAFTDHNWLANLKRVLGKSAQVKTTGRWGKNVSLREKEFEDIHFR
ncbi:hypothetical protein RQP46_008115 [Phenoliferia psychrophenolica]